MSARRARTNGQAAPEHFLDTSAATHRRSVPVDWIKANPAWRIKKPGQERSRDRVLTRDELRELWPALHETAATNPDGTPKPRLSQTLNDMLIVMLLTAQRRGEVCTMRWQDVDLVTGWWLIPAESSKNADPHGVPLTPMALEILERRASATTATSDTCSRITGRRVWSIGRKRRQRFSATAACRSTSVRTTCGGRRHRTWAKRASIAFTSRMRSIIAA